MKEEKKDLKIKRKVVKLGSSAGIILDKTTCQLLNIKVGDYLIFDINNIEVQKNEQKQR
jgi:antitoxin component of MazEF toxin-antitoxin module